MFGIFRRDKVENYGYYVHVDDPIKLGWWHHAPHQKLLVPRVTVHDTSLTWKNGTKRFTDHVMDVAEFKQLMRAHHRFAAKYECNPVVLHYEGDLVEMMKWCQENVTGFLSRWSVKYISEHRNARHWNEFSRMIFYFTKKDHAMMFKLTFGG